MKYSQAVRIMEYHDYTCCKCFKSADDVILHVELKPNITIPAGTPFHPSQYRVICEKCLGHKANCEKEDEIDEMIRALNEKRHLMRQKAAICCIIAMDMLERKLTEDQLKEIKDVSDKYETHILFAALRIFKKKYLIKGDQYAVDKLLRLFPVLCKSTSNEMKDPSAKIYGILEATAKKKYGQPMNEKAIERLLRLVRSSAFHNGEVTQAMVQNMINKCQDWKAFEKKLKGLEGYYV